MAAEAAGGPAVLVLPPVAGPAGLVEAAAEKLAVVAVAAAVAGLTAKQVVAGQTWLPQAKGNTMTGFYKRDKENLPFHQRGKSKF